MGRPCRSGGVPGPRPNSVPLCTERARGSLQVGERSGGGQARGRAARSACAGAPCGSGLGAPGRAGCSGRRARLIVPRVRGRPAAGGAAQVRGGRAGAGGRRARARLVVGVSVFFSPTPLGRPRGAWRPPGPAGAVRAAAAAAAAGLRAARSVPCNLSGLLLPSPRVASSLPRRRRRRPACRTPERPAPAPAPRDPRPGRPRARRAPGGGAGRGAPRREKGTGPETCGRGGELRGPRRRSRAAAPRGTRGVADRARAPGSPAPLPARRGDRLGCGEPAPSPRWSLAEPGSSSASGPARSGPR